MAYWLVKTEPSDYAFGDLVREGKTVWAGVKNPLARRHLAEMKKGDVVLIYHTGDEKAVVGLGKVIKEGAEPEIGAGKALGRPVRLAEIKGDKRFANWGLVRIGRLSVVPTTKEEFEGVVGFSEEALS